MALEPSIMPQPTLESHAPVASAPNEKLSAGAQAFLANIRAVTSVSPEVARAIVQELIDQRTNLKLIASENYCSLAVQSAMANLLTDKYAEGVPYKRFYAGCDNVDHIEDLARQTACKLFNKAHAYVQPHSGADANLVAFWAILSTKIEAPAFKELNTTDPNQLSRPDWEKIRQSLGNQRLLGMDLSAGGHLTHGYRRNVSARMFDAYGYGVSPSTNLIDYDEVARIAREVRPLILLAGYSAYSRKINFARMREIADSVGAVLMVDMAHFAGLVAGKVFTGEFNPVPYAQVVTTTTHKTLRGPRGGMVLCGEEFAEQVDKGCPLVLGGPLSHVMAAKAVNAQALSAALVSNGCKVVTGGTDNHLLLVDVTPYGITGRQAESAVRECGITLNRNTIPFDANGPWYTSGLRLGTAATTTLGMREEEMKEIAAILALVLSNTTPDETDSGTSKAKYHVSPDAAGRARAKAQALLSDYPVYAELPLDALRNAAGMD
jgi:glycine hydroxymethyltransferase